MISEVHWKGTRAVIALFVALVVCLAASGGRAAGAAPEAPPPSVLGESLLAQAQAELRALIVAGNLSDLRWPNFTDYREQVFTFYEAGVYSLAWVRNQTPTMQAQAMIGKFKDAARDGLDPDDYDGSRWDARLAGLRPSAAPPLSQSELIRFDLALTICAMRYVSDLRIGRVNPQHFKFGLDIGPKRYDLTDFLRNQVVYSQDVDAAIDKLQPPYSGYQRVKVALATYQKLAAEGDGESLPMAPKAVRPGQIYAGMRQLIARLHQLGDLPAGGEIPSDATGYRGSVVDAVKHFQLRHGLEPDGTLGKGTLAELNIPLGKRVRQLQLTLERYRWLPEGFPEPPIVVNIPEFQLSTLHRQPAPFLTMRVVVGHAYRRQTPVFANYMRYIIFRPYWEVPLSIQRGELVPKIRRNRNYLATDGFEVVDEDGNVVTDGAVSDAVLSQLSTGALSIRQKPGPKNALGLVKFIFPNSYNVYLHSTPMPELFLKARRDFSHGCIRVEDPVALAAWVLRDQPEWTVDRIRSTMNGGQTLQVNLRRPIPVLILYSTALVDRDGVVHFFDDIYGHDASLERALALGYPRPS